MPKEYYSEDGKSWLSYDKKDRTGTPGMKASKRKFHEAYESAFYTAGENSEKYRRRGRGDRDDDDVKGAGLVAITAVISIIFTVLIYSLILHCYRKRQRQATRTESELAAATAAPSGDVPASDAQ